jgi:transposase-like protein
MACIDCGGPASDGAKRCLRCYRTRQAEELPRCLDCDCLLRGKGGAVRCRACYERRKNEEVEFRRRVICRRLAAGFTISEIATELGLSPGTLRAYYSHQARPAQPSWTKEQLDEIVDSVKKAGDLRTVRLETGLTRAAFNARLWRHGLTLKNIMGAA